MLKKCLENVRKNKPLIHNITNYVTVNDCANILLACGGSPIMADDIFEVEDITSVCSGLNINIGTLNSRTVRSMLLAGTTANKLSHPVLLDPVGAGASKLRTNTAQRIIENVKLAVIRGNISEIKALAAGTSAAHGVDADEADKLTEDTLDGVIALAQDFSAKTGAVIVISGETDIVAGKDIAYIIRNGCEIMGAITGTGCMLSAVTAAFVCANPDNMTEAAAAAVCAMGLCGEIAQSRMGELDGNAGCRNYIIDAMYNLTAEQLEKGAKYEVRELYDLTCKSSHLNKTFPFGEGGTASAVTDEVIGNGTDTVGAKRNSFLAQHFGIDEKIENARATVRQRLNIENKSDSFDLKKALKLYAVTDRAWVGRLTLSEQIEAALKGGVTCVQLREKHLGYDEFLAEAIEVKALCEKYNVPLIINDNAMVALDAHADGLHVGQDDMDIKELRWLVGENMIIGVSAHSIEEAVYAEQNGADYLGLGSVFPTSTKDDVSVMSYDTLKKICDTVDIPCVAIGGINKDNAARLSDSGIAGIAVVSAIFGAEDITAASKELLKLI